MKMTRAASKITNTINPGFVERCDRAMSPVFAVASVAVESGLRMSSGGGRKVERPWAHNLLKY